MYQISRSTCNTFIFKTPQLGFLKNASKVSFPDGTFLFEKEDRSLEAICESRFYRCIKLADEIWKFGLGLTALGKPIMSGLANSVFNIVMILLCSCSDEMNCEWEREAYEEEWDYEVDTVYRYTQYQATYIIGTKEGKKLKFRPIQDIVSRAEPGDKIVKEKMSEFAYLVQNGDDTLRSRIFSVSCDEVVVNQISR